ncbi:hypothetical protein HZH68_001440 [Vespula germanica]|uniref:Uncharacterized protein n=1 Tax=Vespula germanica TaxID=30212 RepID=A0A834U6Y4_VESGE|nr:hypothetical protein HZH68_001440 [Vespula germanica]
MSSSVKFTSDELLGESWVEVNPISAERRTPLPFSSGGEEYLRLLREAQRDSTQSSARHSLASSRRDTPRDSPKSPPNSPNTELSTEDELKGVYINYSCNKKNHKPNPFDPIGSKISVVVKDLLAKDQNHSNTSFENNHRSHSIDSSG